MFEGLGGHVLGGNLNVSLYLGVQLYLERRAVLEPSKLESHVASRID